MCSLSMLLLLLLMRFVICIRIYMTGGKSDNVHVIEELDIQML